MSAETLEAALRDLGIECRVEAIDRLAVITPESDEVEQATIRARREMLRLLPAHGFTHLALELRSESADRAPVHRD